MIRVAVEADPGLTAPEARIARRWLRETLRREGCTEGAVTLIFGDDALLRDLKKRFFQKDQVSDVIAFRLNEYSETFVEGEIYISLPRARENAAYYQEPLAREVTRLIIHGGLHLLGYADDTPPARSQMQAREEQILESLDWKALFRV